MKPTFKVMGLGLLTLLAACAQDAAPTSIETSAAATELFFSEYAEGSSSNKALEVYNGTGVAVDLAADGYNVQMYFNGNTAAGLTATLTGSVAAGDVYVLAPNAANLAPAIKEQADLLTSSTGWFNGDDAVVLRKGTTILDVIGQIGFDPGSEWGTGLASTADNTLRRQERVLQGDPNGADAFAPATEWSGFATDTFAGLGRYSGENAGGGGVVDPGVCAAEATLISAVQGSGAATPLAGQTATIEGVVLGDYQDAFDGFFVQEEAADADGNPATSEGVFVYNNPRLALELSDVSAGDVVRVQGTVGEAFGQTQLSLVGSGSVRVCGGATVVAPTDVQLPVASLGDLEAFEGMLVRFPQSLVIAEYFNYDRFGELVLAQPPSGLDRPYTPTSYAEPGADAAAAADLNLRSRILLDDGLGTQNPEVTRHPNGEPFSLENRFRGGDTVTDTVGVLDYRFNLYRVQPTQAAVYTPQNPRTPAPDEVGGSLKVASFNVLNYFTTLTSQDGNARGADNAEEFERQEAKIVAALAAIDADIFGLIEIENNGDTAVQTLVDALNAEVGAGTYSFVPTGTIGTDAIKVAFIYKPATASPAGNFAVLDSDIDPRFIDTANRPALIQTFDEVATGGRLTVTVNHLKSKGSACAGDPDTGDGQGNCNETRTAAAAALADYLATDPTGSGDEDFLIIGDLNSYDEEDPIRVLEVADYSDLNEAFGGEYAYSYAFDGQFGYLDYALSSAALTPQVTGTTEWHINADEPDLLDYDTSFKSEGQDALYAPDPYRSSDHDPVVVGLDLTTPDPKELLADLIDEVLALGLKRGDERALVAQLETAQRHLGQGQDASADAALGRFEAQVERLVAKGVLTPEQGEALQDGSQTIRDLL